MIAVLVVSHSRPLAEAAVSLASQMVGAGDVPVAIAAGTAEGGLGTDALAVVAGLEQLDNPDGTLVLSDLGSAVLSAEMALEMVDPSVARRVLLSPAPLVEGLVAGLVTAGSGAGLRECAAEAARGLAAKQAHLGGDELGEVESSDADGAEVRAAIVRIVNPSGLHARPAATLVSAAGKLGGEIRLRNVTTGSGWVSAVSLTGVMILGAALGHEVEVEAGDPAAVSALVELIAAGLGEL
ncbi:MAG: dihydroxyacetone kinase phosphoryl donor subunit DhaM [Micrococcales bacterium]|nr:dihydroxyacetone kinase phosphoryl donor subunit DhaM [Micrococcales bacterium]